jgi:5-hydroxyisourate hydrolase
MGKLTTHILDTAAGKPGKNIRIDLYRISGSQKSLVKTVTSNDDGRCDSPLLEGADLTEATYELAFHAGAYFDAQGLDLPEPKFLDEIILRFGIPDASQHYHVPLLVSPYSYSTYRGS